MACPYVYAALLRKNDVMYLMGLYSHLARSQLLAKIRNFRLSATNTCVPVAKTSDLAENYKQVCRKMTANLKASVKYLQI